MSETQKIERNVNLDLLRIFSMFLIVFLHSIDHSGVLENAQNSSTWMYIYVRFTYAFTQVCVNCYVLLSGYFLVKSKFRLQKIVGLWMEVVFYSLVIKLIFMTVGMVPFSAFSLISCFFPILTGRYWFITIYIGLYMLAPFLNKLIYAMDRRQHMILNILLFCMFSVWVSFHPAIAGMNSGRGWGLPWFVVLYFVAAWFRLYYNASSKRSVPAIMLLICICISALMAATSFITRNIGISLFESIINNWYKYDSVPVYIMSVCLMILFLEIKINNETTKKWIVKLAPATLGVYLIHAHAELSPWLWNILALPEKMNSVLFILVQIAVVTIILAFCSVIDLLRNCSIGRLEHHKKVYELCDLVMKKEKSKCKM